MSEEALIKDKGDVIKDLIDQLCQGGLGGNNLRELIDGLGMRLPGNDTIKKLSETLDVELELERDESEFPWIIFSLSDTAYAINSRFVLSIEILGKITPVVDTAHYSPGITQSRGEMIELIDMLALFGSGDYISAGADKSNAVSMMIVTDINGVKRGMIVDEILAVEHISRFDENIMGDREGALTSQYVRQIAKRDKTDDPVLILNTDNLALA